MQSGHKAEIQDLTRVRSLLVGLASVAWSKARNRLIKFRRETVGTVGKTLMLNNVQPEKECLRRSTRPTRSFSRLEIIESPIATINTSKNVGATAPAKQASRESIISEVSLTKDERTEASQTPRGTSLNRCSAG